jgi:O-glycosyl hydrolase
MDICSNKFRKLIREADYPQNVGTDTATFVVIAPEHLKEAAESYDKVLNDESTFQEFANLIKSKMGALWKTGMDGEYRFEIFR